MNLSQQEAVPFSGRWGNHTRFINKMYVYSAILVFYIAQAFSLKDKRGVARSLIDKVKHKYNTAIAEVDTQDLHQTLTIGIAVVSGNAAHAENMLNEVIQYMENHADAELVSIEKNMT